MNLKQEQAISPIEVLTFRRGDRQATVCTDGLHFASYDEHGRIWHKLLTSAVAHLEAQGYKIVIDLWTKLQ